MAPKVHFFIDSAQLYGCIFASAEESANFIEKTFLRMICSK